MAVATTAGSAAGVLTIVSAANSACASVAGSATVMVAASAIVTAILVPFITAWWAKRVNVQLNKTDSK
ncbi:2-keto-3-deoxygluconate permease [Brevibacillus ginsengisoli]|uniref:2-keto-3-deoxygluconate permease n=1 Tax=Brevibacillus ginsengisoli TaxID=363854 RepID=UPI003CF06770